MGQILILILIYISCSCIHVDDQEINAKVIVLKNNIGEVHIDLRPEFDNYNETYGISGCGCCSSSLSYRFKYKSQDNMPILDTIRSY
jgi:hypothetical protein